jgi:hypothetical protein
MGMLRSLPFGSLRDMIALRRLPGIVAFRQSTQKVITIVDCETWKCNLWMSFARKDPKKTETKQTLRSPMKASKQSDCVRTGLISASEYEKWLTSPSMIMIAVCIDRMVERKSLANVDKNTMADERAFPWI